MIRRYRNRCLANGLCGGSLIESVNGLASPLPLAGEVDALLAMRSIVQSAAGGERSIPSTSALSWRLIGKPISMLHSANFNRIQTASVVPIKGKFALAQQWLAQLHPEWRIQGET